MGRSRTKDAAGKPITCERVEEFFSFLQGNEIEGIHCDNMPRLTRSQAYSVIYFLQEHIEVLPDEIEQCGECEGLIDTYSDGHYIEDVGSFCDGCGPIDSPDTKEKK